MYAESLLHAGEYSQVRSSILTTCAVPPVCTGLWENKRFEWPAFYAIAGYTQQYPGDALRAGLTLAGRTESFAFQRDGGHTHGQRFVADRVSTFDLGLLPSGHLHCFHQQQTIRADKALQNAPISKAFARDISEGLFTLAARKSGADLSPSLQYWRSFACKYLSERCLLAPTDPHHPDPVEPFTATETMPLLLSVPPMRGAEYLSASVLQDIRSLLDAWVCEQIRGYRWARCLLAMRAPQWHQVGRVCFHLAENKNDPDFPLPSWRPMP